MPAKSRNIEEIATSAARGGRTERVLAQKAALGAVTALGGEMIEITFEGQALRIAAARYWLFMELMSDASRQLARQRFLS